MPGAVSVVKFRKRTSQTPERLQLARGSANGGPNELGLASGAVFSLLEPSAADRNGALISGNEAGP
jgi:hypothetical protein